MAYLQSVHACGDLIGECVCALSQDQIQITVDTVAINSILVALTFLCTVTC